MQLIVAMAGGGSRFLKAGYTIPKPLIEVHGKPMVEYVVSLFPGEENVLFVANNEHLKTPRLKDVLLRMKPRATIAGIEHKKRGPVLSILSATDHIRDHEPVIVTYCDFNMGWDYSDFKRTIREKNPDSASVCYRGFHPHLLGPNLYAGVRADDDLNALEVKEKFSFTENKMETWQQAGIFYFRNGALLKKYANEIVERDVTCNGEHFVSLLFNPMIRDGLFSLVYPVRYFCQWGTPEDLEEYNAWMDAAANPRETEAHLASSEADILDYWRLYREQFGNS